VEAEEFYKNYKDPEDDAIIENDLAGKKALQIAYKVGCTFGTSLYNSFT
jgi:hypothetical protein